MFYITCLDCKYIPVFFFPVLVIRPNTATDCGSSKEFAINSVRKIVTRKRCLVSSRQRDVAAECKVASLAYRVRGLLQSELVSRSKHKSSGET